MSTKRNQAQAISSPSSSTGNGEGHSNGNDDHIDKKFKQVHGDGDEDDDDDEDEEAPKSGKRAGRRKIKIEYIEDKSRRHITFSKRKSGIMKKSEGPFGRGDGHRDEGRKAASEAVGATPKSGAVGAPGAFELSTLTGTQVLLLVVSETGLVYTFTTPKLQPLVTKAEGKNLIQACLHAPDKEPTPDPNASGDQESREPTPVAEYEERQATTPQGSSQIQASNSSHASPQQQQQQHYQQQQQQAPPPLQGPPSGGYGSSSAMSVPTYPPPYNNIPFPAQYNYPNMGMHYQNAQNGPPGYGGGNQYWSGPPTQQQSDQDQQVKGGRKDK
ncbi:hypothetical protein KVV02_001688 [Mortierella alpina]|uniref:MADS-box domain-containing protein n=1 Tax=Mortierella alpina TaxID=64518 RepID=A0A9P8CWE6_MORAP|nr:hypothetical protein KVV02_001688 [Mortierella alpina]